MTETTVAERLEALIEAYPGLHVRELARQLGTSIALVQYHLDALVAAGRVDLRKDERFMRAFPRGVTVPARDRDALEHLRREHPLGITLELLRSREPMRHGELADNLGLAKSHLSFYLDSMRAAGLVEKTEDGAFRLRDPERLRRLLEKWRPTPDLITKLEDLWGDLYDGKP